MKILDSGLKPKSYNFTKNIPEFLLIHHALATNCTIKDLYTWHVIDNKWNFIGYHFFITKDGKIYKCREIEWNGAHCKEQKMNNRSIGICLEGCYEKYEYKKGKFIEDKIVPELQMNALIELTQNLTEKYKIPTAKVKRHHDFASYKLCPGDNFPWNSFIEELKKPKIANWKLEAYKTAREIGYISSDWSEKLNEDIPVWAMFIMLNNLYKKLK